MTLIVTSNVNTYSKVEMQNQKAIFRIQLLNEEKKRTLEFTVSTDLVSQTTFIFKKKSQNNTNTFSYQK